MTNDGGIGTRCPCKSTTVTGLLLNVANNGSFWALADGENVADSESCLLAAVDKGTGVETFCCDKCFLAKLVSVWVPENDTGKRGSSVNKMFR